MVIHGFFYKTLRIKAAKTISQTSPQINPAIIKLKLILSNNKSPSLFREIE